MQLKRVLHRACQTCYAPGHYSDHPVVRDGYSEDQIAALVAANPAADTFWFRRGWPEVYDPRRSGEPVGHECPCCGSPRSGPTMLKTIKIRG